MKYIRWTIVNALLAALLYYGFIVGIPGAHNAAMFALWLLIVLSVIAPYDKEAMARSVIKAGGFTMPKWFDWIYDLSVALLLAWHSHFWTAGFIIVGAICMSLIRDEVDRQLGK